MIEKNVKEIATILGAKYEGNGNDIIRSFAGIEDAKEGDITFLSNAKYTQYLSSTKATAVLVNKNFKPNNEVSTTLLYVENPYIALATLLQLVSTKNDNYPIGISPQATVAPDAIIGKDTYIGPFVVIEEGVHIGVGCKIHPFVYVGRNCIINDGTVLYPHVTLYNNTKIGKECILHAGCCLGADGFGFVPSEKGLEKIPQLGNVTIGDKVEIGAGTCIDRSVMGTTIINDGVKLDNLVQIGHNCSIKENSVISAQSGLAGSTHLGSWCRVGGQVGFAGHIHIGDYSEIGAQSGVIKDLPPKSRVLGSPAFPAQETLRGITATKKVPDLVKEVKELKNKLEVLEKLLCNKEH